MAYREKDRLKTVHINSNTRVRMEKYVRTLWKDVQKMSHAAPYRMIYVIMLAWFILSGPLTVAGSVFLTDVFVPVMISGVICSVFGSFVMLWYSDHLTLHELSVRRLIFGEPAQITATQPDAPTAVVVESSDDDAATEALSDAEPPAFDSEHS